MRSPIFLKGNACSDFDRYLFGGAIAISAKNINPTVLNTCRLRAKGAR
ncbi:MULTISPECIES: hypothetical protein [unclassified Tolypothrix]|nr:MULTISPECIES: hypothetical protein [unclassified Tolypothrix]MBE9087317.1 hypothetical protein [Tolypothrix sp. LEGE 11397]UYD38492.1 hypothetical protein HG267_39075 [Tolypothrix sp. PCC 7601]